MFFDGYTVSIQGSRSVNNDQVLQNLSATWHIGAPKPLEQKKKHFETDLKEIEEVEMISADMLQISLWHLEEVISKSLSQGVKWLR